MRAKILKIEPEKSGGNTVTVSIGKVTTNLFDPEEMVDEKFLKKELEVKICGLEGTAEKSEGPEKFDRKTIVAKVVEKDLDYVVLDCGLFTFDYMMNMGDEEKFIVGEFIAIENPRLDIVLPEK